MFTSSKYNTELNPNGEVITFHKSPIHEINLTGKLSESCDKNDVPINAMENCITENSNNKDIVKSSLKRKEKKSNANAVHNLNHCYNVCNQGTTSMKTKSCSEVSRQYEIAERRTECNLWYRCPAKWTTEMITFYTKPEKSKLNFDYLNVLSEIRDEYNTSAADWAVNPLELSGCLSKAYSRLVCSICNGLGHTRLHHCSEKPRPTVCILCGIQGHNYRKCNKKMCISCGTRQMKFTKTCRNCVPLGTSIECNICGAVDHIPRYCTESWRKFHSTISTVEK